MTTLQRVTASSKNTAYAIRDKLSRFSIGNPTVQRWLSLINPRRACAARVTVAGSVRLSVSVKSHLTSGVSAHPENAVMYSVGNEGQKICGVFVDTCVNLTSVGS